MYRPVDIKAHFPSLEEEVLKYWEDNNIFKKSILKNKGKKDFIFYDGPPFATGTPHFGRFVPSTVKDIIPRYKTMQGYHVPRRFGWDCHGLPVEYEVEKELSVFGKYNIEEYGVSKFNEHCRSIVMRYTSQWQDVIKRLGRWVDFENAYKTMDINYMESIWWVFSQLWKKGLIYQGHYILPYSPKLATPLSNFEVKLGRYQDVHDPAVTVRFECVDETNTYFLAWTTTPWTLPSNMGLGVHQKIKYVRIKDTKSSDLYILAESRLPMYYKNENEYKIEQKFLGADLRGMRYKPLFPYFAYLEKDGGFVVHTADFVDTENGTGIVHLAGGFGEDDYNIVCKKAGLPVICPIDDECRFTNEIPEYKGLFVKDTDKLIILRLKKEGKLIKKENYLHSYPFCYRTQQPIIYRAVQSWFVNVQKVKKNMIHNNNKVLWYPSHLQQGRFGKWLEGARDWVISRNRFWGNLIPVWTNEDGTHIEVIESVAQLEEKSGKKITDIHKHFVDKITWQDKGGKGTMRRIDEVLDCWFESGAMPYAQNHYPFDVLFQDDKKSTSDIFSTMFPADFISEGLDQTRGWFYTLTILGAALFEKSPFQNVIVNGLVLAEDGKKMSKSKRNYTDPMKVIHKFGSDALRLFLMNSPVLKAGNLKYSDEAVEKEIKKFILPLWSAYSFFITYANIDDVMLDAENDTTATTHIPKHNLDIWIISEASALVNNVTTQLDTYDILSTIFVLNDFLDLLNNWYIRRSRRRFWKSSNDEDKLQAYATLYKVLLTFIKLAAPVVPFVTENMYLNLKTNKMPESVHLCDFPVYDKKDRNLKLEQKMNTVRRAVTLGRGIRSIHQLKNRQPLQTVYFSTRDDKEKEILQEMQDVIIEELNVKQVIFRDKEEDLVSYTVKANFKILGQELGKNMKEAATKIAMLQSVQIKNIIDKQSVKIQIAEKTINLTIDNVIIERQEKDGLKVLNELSLTVALDTHLSKELIQEGKIRDMVRCIQNMRKDQKFNVVDRILLTFFDVSDDLKDAIERFKTYLGNETLAKNITYMNSKNFKDDKKIIWTKVSDDEFGIFFTKSETTL